MSVEKLKAIDLGEHVIILKNVEAIAFQAPEVKFYLPDGDFIGMEIIEEKLVHLKHLIMQFMDDNSVVLDLSKEQLTS